MHYQTFSDLVNEVKNLNGESQARMQKSWRNSIPIGINYLEPTPAFMAFLAYLPGGIAKGSLSNHFQPRTCF